MSTIEQLEEQIRRHDRLYWKENAPAIADVEYDALVKQLRDLDPDHELVNRIPESAGTFKHRKPMLSLAKAYTPAEVKAWAVSVARNDGELFRIGPKLDGCACECAPSYMVTRGDGETGEVITDKKAITDLSSWCGKPERGELVVFKNALLHLKKSDGKPYANCRAAASGLLGLKETDPSLLGVLRFLPHSLSLGEVSLQELCNEIDFEATLLDEQSKIYPIDGLVISLVDKEYGESLGMTSHHPRHSIAFKIANPSTISKLVGVEWQVAKTRIAPVGILEPTELDGITITKATLHNLKEVGRLGLRIGSQVRLERAGSVIPAITAGLSEGKEDIVPPTVCPACASPTESDGQDLRCTNQSCGGMLAKRLRDSLVRLEIEDCGPAVCSNLVRLGFETAADVLRMEQKDWLTLIGFAEKSATKMWEQMQTRLRTPIPDYRILAAQNYEGIGITVSKRIMDKFSPAELPDADLTTVEGMGGVRASAVVIGMGWYDLLTLLQVTTTKGLLSRPTVCFTGKNAMPRDEWIKFADARGYSFARAVTKSLDLLVLADLNSTSTKAEKARKYGVKMMTYKQFQEVTTR